jgi:asparagine synthase (glutamine-hydrolysing)
MAIASSLITKSMLSFSSIYSEVGCNEEAFIEAVVQGCHTQAHRITPTPEDLPAVFDKIAWHQDEPTAGPGLYSQWKVMEVAQGKVKVLLDGQGGDEVIAGYHPYFEDYLFTRAATQNRVSLGEEAAAITSLTGRDYGDVLTRARRHYLWPRFLRNLRKPKPGKIKPPAYVSQDFRRQFATIDARRAAPAALFEERLNQRLYHDITRTSIPGLLRYEDRNSMAYGLEARTPFLDYRLVEFCFALPAVYKIYKSQTKRILRRAMAGYIPKEVLQRQDKLGYPTPAATWFRGDLRGWMEDTLRSPQFAATDLFQVEPVLQVLSDHAGGQDRSWELWRFLATLSWHRQFIKGEGFPPQP